MRNPILLCLLLVGCTTEEPERPEDPVEDLPLLEPIKRIYAASQDTLEEYAAKCDAAVGLHVPAFNCDAMGAAEPAGQERDQDGNCATPNVLNGACDPGSKFQVLAQNSEASVVAHCRKKGNSTSGHYGDIAVIQHNKVNGATCFYQALGDLPGTDVRPPSEGTAAWRWWNPEETRQGGCTGCHDNGAFIRSPYLAQLKTAPHALPSVVQGYDNNTTPLRYVGKDFAGSKSWSITRPSDPPTCTSCHRLAVNNYSAGGSAAYFARIATAPSQASKQPHSASSPIRMKPGQTFYDPTTAASALAIEDCATAFRNNWFLWTPPNCSITPLGDAYTPSFNASHGDDILAFGASTEGAGIVSAFSRDDGSFTATNSTVGWFGALAKIAGIKKVTGDFNKDGRLDIALVGGVNWDTLPLALSNGDGTFQFSNQYVGIDFNNWARTANVKALVGDYNKDGMADIALTGAAGWASIPVAFSYGNGNFQITNYGSGIAGLASQPNVTPIVGDFNKDGASDIALVGNGGFAFIPVAFSWGAGTWVDTFRPAPSFPQHSAVANVKPIVGDFNGDGFSDIALTGGAGWASIPVAINAGNGNFTITNFGVPSFGSWASTSGAKPLAGDFNRDGRTDIALTGGPWGSIPVAISLGNGTFAIINNNVLNFASWANTANVKPVVGDFNKDGWTDIALTGSPYWSSIPVAFGTGIGAFNITNRDVLYFPGVAADANTTLAAGPLN